MATKKQEAEEVKKVMARTDKPVTEKDIEAIIKLIMDGNNMPIDIIQESKYNMSRAEFIGYYIQKYCWENHLIEMREPTSQMQIDQINWDGIGKEDDKEDR